MNPQLINRIILEGKDDSSNYSKNEDFYKYLLNNNVAYYYSTCITKHKNSIEENIIESGNSFNKKYFRTLALIDNVCKKENIKFALFKTYKHIPEAVDGDIDLFVPQKDFHRFLNVFKKEGFVCHEDEPSKGQCVKRDFAKIEPRSNVSFHGIEVFSEDQVWKNTEEVNIQEMEIIKTTKAFDTVCLLLNTLYGPNYIKLYLYKVANTESLDKLYSIVTPGVKDDLEYIVKHLLSADRTKNKFPLFHSDLGFFLWWVRRILLNREIGVYLTLKHLGFFFYSKYNYLLFNNLPFSHNWGIKNGKQ